MSDKSRLRALNMLQSWERGFILSIPNMRGHTVMDLMSPEARLEAQAMIYPAAEKAPPEQKASLAVLPQVTKEADPPSKPVSHVDIVAAILAHRKGAHTRD